MQRMIIDNDGLSDDVAAIIMACSREDISIEAVTVVRGGVDLNQAVQNNLYTLELCNQEIPVYAGANNPLMRELISGDYHGVDGLGDLGLPLHGRSPRKENAVNILCEQINQYPHEILLVVLGPLTNVALAIKLDPSIIKKVKRCVIMGSAGLGIGNVTPVSEANIWMDPESAKIVLESGMNIELVGWDIAYTDGIFTPKDQEDIRNIGNDQARFFVDVNDILMKNAMENNNFPGVDYADPIAMAVALDPSMASFDEVVPTVITTDDITRGQVVLAKKMRHIPEGSSKIKVVTKVDHDAFKKMIHSSLKAYSS